jgi:hypothetical protein
MQPDAVGASPNLAVILRYPKLLFLVSIGAYPASSGITHTIDDRSIN